MNNRDMKKISEEDIKQWIIQSFFRVKKKIVDKETLKKLKVAFTHPSYKGVDKKAEDNQRLEFLGDSVVNLIAAEKVFKSHKKEHEGDLTIRKSQEVSNNKLSFFFDHLKMKKIISTAPKYVPNKKDKADFIEAFFGAIFLTKGYTICKEVWKEMERITEQKKTHNKRALKNAKNALQEYCQKNRIANPKYILVKREGKPHEPIFTIRVSIEKNGEVYYATGKGKRKKIAEHKAAQNLCKQLNLSFHPIQKTD